MHALGVDRCRGGWVVAHVDGGAVLEIAAVDTVDDIIDRWPGVDPIGIDLPLYLVPGGRRHAESDLRRLLGRAASSVFTSPTLDALGATTQAEASARNRAAGGPGISIQSFGLFASIIEARTAIGSGGGAEMTRWHETHPETAFAVMADAAGMSRPLASKRTALGFDQRLSLLAKEFDPVGDAVQNALGQRPRPGRDDVLDAFAAAWSAGRIAANTAVRFGTGEVDAAGWRDLIEV